MESVEVVCVEIQENENGEIVCVEKMENNNPETSQDFCVVECEIATSEDTSSNCRETASPVEIIVFPNFSDKVNTNDTNGKELEIQKKSLKEHEYNMTLTSAELALHKDTQRFSDERKASDDFDIVLKLAMRGESNMVTRMPPKHQLEEVNIQEINDVQEITMENEKSKLWTLLDKQERRTTVSKRFGRMPTVSNNVRRAYSSSIPKKSLFKESHNGCFSEHPFRCKICDQRFRQDSSLKIHLKVHAGKFSDNCIIN